MLDALEEVLEEREWPIFTAEGDDDLDEKGPPGLDPKPGPPGMDPKPGPPGMDPKPGPPGMDPKPGPPGMDEQ